MALFSWTAAIVAVLDDHAVVCDDQPASGEDACWPCYWPATGAGGEFYPGAVYRINIDNDGDNQAYVAFTFVFSEVTEGKQTGTAWYATGTQARQAEPGGEVLAEGIPVSFDGTAQPVQVGRPHPAVHRAAQRPVRRCRGCPARLRLDRARRLRFAWLTNGKIPPAGLKPHDDLLTEFPYLGAPNPRRVVPDRTDGPARLARKRNGGHPDPA